MNNFLEIAAYVIVAWVLLSLGFAAFWSILKKREPHIEESEDALAGDH